MMDFPASPTNGQVFTSAGVSYTWNGYAWVGGIPGAGADAPSDGGEYVRVNGVWRLKEQSFTLDGLTQQDITVPTGAKQVQLVGNAYWLATVSGLGLRVSFDGTTFLAGATDYSLGGYPSHSSGSAGFLGTTAGGAAFLPLTNAHDHLTLPALFTAEMNLVKNNTYFFMFKSYGKSYYSLAQNLFSTIWPVGFPATAAAASALRVVTLRVFWGSGGTFGPGSTVSARWMY
jgi:hypothetical protein